ncbi:MAG: ATP-binding cassette domain-containing protein [Streptosporangiaceae bacterium]
MCSGAGKTTTMRLMVGLDRPDAGRVTVVGHSYRDLSAPLHAVGALLDATAVYKGRSAFSHLLCLAQSNRIPRVRVTEVLQIVGLTEAAGQRTT